MTVTTSDNRYSVNEIIVAPTLKQGANYTTITDALAAASSGDTIFIKPGTYTEDITLKAGVNITSFNGNKNQVNIVGKMSFTEAGTVLISNISCDTNGDYYLDFGGSSTSTLEFTDCILLASDNDGFTYSNSDASSILRFDSCSVLLSGTSLKTFDHSSAGTLIFNYSSIVRSNATTPLASVGSAGVLSMDFCTTTIAYNFTGTYSRLRYSFFEPPVGSSCITDSSGYSPFARFCWFIASTVPCLVINGTTAMLLWDCEIKGDTDPVISGTGVLRYGNITFPNFNLKRQITTNTTTSYALTAPQGGTGIASYTAGDILYYSSGDTLTALGVGSDGEVLTLASGVPSWASGGGGVLVQRVYASTTTQSTTTAVIPYDDTIPQNTEGTEYITLAITPTSETTRLRIYFSGYGSNGATAGGIIALFQDSTADALTMTSNGALTNSAITYSLNHDMASGTTSSTTFKIRIGSASSGTAYINRIASLHTLGGVSTAWLFIDEYTP